MENTRDASGQAQWTLADFLCTYRYWALFLAWLLVIVCNKGLTILLPLLSQQMGLSYQNIAILYTGVSIGWLVAAFIAFVAASRHGKEALLWPMAVCATAAATYFVQPGLWGSPVFLILFGLTIGTVQALFPLATAIFLVGGRPGKIDFAGAMVLLSGTILFAFLGPFVFAPIYQPEGSIGPILLGFIAFHLLAIALIATTKHIAFDDAPRQRHQPLAPRRRSPPMVAVILMAGPILWLTLAVSSGIFGADVFMGNEPAALVFSLLLLAVSIAVVIYFLYWVYRIHGELAGAQASQRLVSPLPAMFIAILVPLGLPVLVMTLGELLNDRASDKGQKRPLSIGWLAFWAFCVPPIAMAMIQNAANRSYTESAAGA